MKREAIELLLAAYVSGEITDRDKQTLEHLFEQDPALRAEADNMITMWQTFDKLENAAMPPEAMRSRFYDMLDNEQDTLHAPAKIISIKRPLLQAAAAVLIGAIIFAAGRYTVSSVQMPVVKYQTVYVKQPAIMQPTTIKPAAIAAVPIIKKKHSIAAKPAEDTQLAQQLRSVYASERIGAITKITGKGNLSANDLQQLELALKEDPNSNVRLTILDALRPLVDQQNVQAVLIGVLSKEENGLVKSTIVDLLIDSKSKQAIPQMIALLNDANTSDLMKNKIKTGIESFLN